MTLFRRRVKVAKKTKLTRAAVTIGTAVGKADRAAHQIARAGVAARDELAEIAKQIDALKRQLVKTKKRLQRALK
jgi:ribosome-associated translation inhibitor RaiA